MTEGVSKGIVILFLLGLGITGLLSILGVGVAH